MIYNFLLGKKVVDPDKLTPIDVEELYLDERLPGETDSDVRKFRDVMKQYATAKTDGELARLETDLRLVMSFIKNSDSREKLVPSK